MSVSFWFLAGVALMTLLDRSFVVPALLGVMALHEGAHLFFMRLYGARVRRVSLRLYGARIDADLSALSARRRVTVFLCAPALNLLLGAALCLTDPSSIGGVFHLLVGAFNLLPVPPLDGGNAAAAVFTSDRAARAARRAALAALGAAAPAAVWLCLRQRNATLLICVIYLFFTMFAKN